MRPTPVSILRLLADGRYHRVEAVARDFGVPLGDVQQALRELKDWGAALQFGPGGDVRLAEPLELIDAPAVCASLLAADLPVTLEVLDACASTNTELMARAAQGAASGSALACELQTAGRGRRGTVWLSPPGGALAFSLLWRMRAGGHALTGLSLAAGVACVRALHRCDLTGVGLKWPNDIVHRGSKLGGILIETAPDEDGTAVVCGIGLNTRLTDAAREAITQPVTDVASIATPPPTRTTLLAALLIELARAMQRFAAHGFGAFRDEWLRHHAHQGQPVTMVLANARTVAGRALGIAEDGALLVEHGGGVERFHSGEVSLRAA